MMRPLQFHIDDNDDESGCNFAVLKWSYQVIVNIARSPIWKKVIVFIYHTCLAPPIQISVSIEFNHLNIDLVVKTISILAICIINIEEDWHKQQNSDDFLEIGMTCVAL